MMSEKLFSARVYDSTSVELAKRSAIAERHPDWPRLDVTFFFAPHSNYADMKQIEPLIKNSDIYLRENLIDHTGTSLYLNTVVSPAMLSEEKTVDVSGHGNKSVRGTAQEAVVRGVHGSGTVTSSFDIGGSEAGRELGDKITASYRVEIPRGADFQDMIEGQRIKFAHIAELQNQREAIMLGNFEHEIDKLLRENPHLAGKDSLNVLISMGLYHTSLHRLFSTAGIKSQTEYTTDDSRVAGEPKVLYSYATEAIRSYARGITPDDDVIARSLAENIISQSITDERNSELSNVVHMKNLRHYVENLSDDEVRELCDMWRESQAA